MPQSAVQLDSHRLRGSGPYQRGSYICLAAQHAGVIAGPNDGGPFLIVFAANLANFTGAAQPQTGPAGSGVPAWLPSCGAASQPAAANRPTSHTAPPPSAPPLPARPLRLQALLPMGRPQTPSGCLMTATL